MVLEPDAVRRVVGVTMQDATLDDISTGRENLRFLGQLWGMSAKESRRRTDELLETFGLIGASDRRVGEFSAGMRRRLDIAAALMNRPKILFLDEPTTSLDPQSRRALWSEIRRLRDDGSTVFLTTQYIEEADELADRIAIIDGGRIIACGTPRELKSRYGRSIISFRLLDIGNGDEMARLFGEARVELQKDSWVRVELPGHADTSLVLNLLSRLQGQNILFENLSVREPALEDVFVQLTGEQIEQDAQPAKVAGAAA